MSSKDIWMYEDRGKFQTKENRYFHKTVSHHFGHG